MRFSTESQRGFTLLEMIVVLLIVSLVSALLMQGFLYMASVYGVVERRQKVQQGNQLAGGWLSDSVRGLVNGIDGASWIVRSEAPFAGTEEGFDGIGLVALSTAGGVVRPLKVEWHLESEASGALALVYSEQRIERDDADRFVVRRWSRGRGRFSYLSEGQWHDRFPVGDKKDSVLPQAIRLDVDSPRAPLQLVIRPGASHRRYVAPRPDLL
ncbi:MAG TPA: hypothetical protein DCQ80_09570 [Pseudomonas sp.]|nr:hypothetical protein [Pseudomonas sp.]